MPKGERTNVLIAGAGPVGLALSIELGLRGVDCVLIERGDGIPRVPRMSSVSARGMEFCRRWGIADKVRYAVWSKTHPLDFVYVSTMVGEELARRKLGSYSERQGKMDYSPEGAASCPQIFFDPILAEKAKSVPKVSVRYGTRLATFDQFETVSRGKIPQGNPAFVRAPVDFRGNEVLLVLCPENFSNRSDKTCDPLEFFTCLGVPDSDLIVFFSGCV